MSLFCVDERVVCVNMEAAVAAAWECISASCGLLDPRSIEALPRFEGVAGVVQRRLDSGHYLVAFRDRGEELLLPASCLVKEAVFVMEKEKLSVFDFCKDVSVPGQAARARAATCFSFSSTSVALRACLYLYTSVCVRASS
jgi:hypothetical protein